MSSSTPVPRETMTRCRAEFCRLLQPYHLPAQWARLDGQCHLRRCGSLTLEALGPLRESCGDGALLATGILEESPDGPQINSGLVCQEWLQAHFADDYRQPTGLSTARGLLTADGPSRAASLELAVTSELARSKNGEIVFVASPDELAFFTALGFVTRMQSTLMAENPQELAAICAAMGWSSWLSPTPDKPEVTPEAILLGWSPANLSLAAPEEFDSHLTYLRQVADCFHRSLDSVNVWRGSADTLARLQFAVTLGRRTDIAEILSDSAADAVLLAARDRPIAPRNFEFLLAEVHRLAATDLAQFEAAVAELRAVYHRQRVPGGPLASRQAAPSNQQTLHQDLLLTKYCDVVRAHARDPAAMKTDLAQYLALSNQLTRMHVPEKW